MQFVFPVHRISVWLTAAQRSIQFFKEEFNCSVAVETKKELKRLFLEQKLMKISVGNNLYPNRKHLNHLFQMG